MLHVLSSVCIKLYTQQLGKRIYLNRNSFALFLHVVINKGEMNFVGVPVIIIIIIIIIMDIMKGLIMKFFFACNL